MFFNAKYVKVPTSQMYIWVTSFLLFQIIFQSVWWLDHSVGVIYIEPLLKVPICEENLIFESHSKLIKNWRFGVRGEFGMRPKKKKKVNFSYK